MYRLLAVAAVLLACSSDTGTNPDDAPWPEARPLVIQSLVTTGSRYSHVATVRIHNDLSKISAYLYPAQSCTVHVQNGDTILIMMPLVDSVHSRKIITLARWVITMPEYDENLWGDTLLWRLQGGYPPTACIVLGEL